MRSATLPRWLPVVLATVTLAGCTSAKLPSAVPNGIVVTVPQETITADEGTIVASVQVFDNGVALLQQAPNVSLTGADSATLAVLTSPTSGVATATFTGVTVAGAVTVTATVGKLSASTTVTVLPGDPVSVSVTPGLASVAADSGVEPFSTASKDKFGNEVTDAPVEVTTNSPVGQVSGVAVSGLHAAGNWLLSAGVAGFPAVVGSAGFAVTAGAAAKVQSSVTETTIQAGATNTLNCAETDQFGNPISGATFTGGVSAPGVVGGATPAFTLSGLVPGLFTATCTDKNTATLHSSVDFDVVDTTPPTATLALIAATGPNGTGLTADGHYASGTTLTFQVSGTKNVGGRIASEQISASGPVVLIGSSIHAEPPTSGTSASFDFQMVVTSPTGSLIDFKSIVVQGQVTDEAGNSALSTQTSQLTVDQGAGIAVANGVTLREFFVFSSPVEANGTNTPVAIATSAGALYVTAETAAANADDSIYRIASAGTAFTTVVNAIGNTSPGGASPNLVIVTAGFGTFHLFQPIADGGAFAAVATLTTSASLNDFPIVSGNLVAGLVFGAVSGSSELLSLDIAGNINQYDPAGTQSPLFINGGQIPTTGPLAIAVSSSSGADVFIVASGGGTGHLVEVDQAGNATTLNSSAGPSGPLAVDNSGRIAMTSGSTLTVFSSTGTTPNIPTTGFASTVGIVASGATLFVLDKGADQYWRVYKVTGY